MYLEFTWNVGMYLELSLLGHKIYFSMYFHAWTYLIRNVSKLSVCLDLHCEHQMAPKVGFKS